MQTLSHRDGVMMASRARASKYAASGVGLQSMALHEIQHQFQSVFHIQYLSLNGSLHGMNML
jgi:hypothetical protein